MTATTYNMVHKHIRRLISGLEIFETAWVICLRRESWQAIGHQSQTWHELVHIGVSDNVVYLKNSKRSIFYQKGFSSPLVLSLIVRSFFLVGLTMGRIPSHSLSLSFSLTHTHLSTYIHTLLFLFLVSLSLSHLHTHILTLSVSRLEAKY